MAYSKTSFVATPIWDQWWFPVTLPSVAALIVLALANVLYAQPPVIPSSTVKVELEKGHGSGVHIGDGLILTAAHVAREGAAVRLKLDDGTYRDAEVLWSSTASDIALLRTSPAGLSSSPLSCAPLKVGQEVTARGNPLSVEFVTTYGHIVGPATKRSDWLGVAPVDMVILPGMSGGPAFNSAGEVIGINVALLTLPLGVGVSATGIGFIVPAEQICGLLGRS
ncbi:serine protease [Devosia neptuniae]|uniref:Serine protease n=1 Tax=Devosia neptuniae TaxID=191302 RepID=A0ABY6CF63_9HYPH|nr:serine protease [Devosia neptuniae]UXN70876.1 serine protease [Devosia neptuniae]